jgi:flagellar assembly protein FliH
LSSEAPAAPAEVYSFRQLHTPAGGPVHDIADVLGAARAQAEQIRAEARLAGHEEGRREAHAQARAEIEPSLRALADAARAVQEHTHELTVQLESDAVLLALRLAEQIVAGAIEVAPERLIEVAATALRRIVDRRDVTLVVNPADLELLKGAVTNVQAELGGIEHLNVQSDRRVGRGGVLARTEAGEIDATIDTQLARARELVIAELTSSHADSASPPA